MCYAFMAFIKDFMWFAGDLFYGVRFLHMTETTFIAQPSRLKNWTSNLTAGVVIGLTEVIFSISLASLIFSGPLEAYLPRGIAMVLVTSAISIIFIAVVSSIEGCISGIQDNPSALFAVAIASMIGAMGTGPQMFPTAIALITVTTLLLGLFLLLLGTFRLGGLMRYIPFPVIGGFLAGTGWLLIHGSIGSMVNYPVTLETLPTLFQADQIVLWLPGLAFGLILFFCIRQFDHFLVMPALLIGAQLLFILYLVVSGTSFEQAAERGLIIGQLGSGAVWQPLSLADVGQVDWRAIVGQAGNIGGILLVSSITLLLDISGLELSFRKDIDLNHELRTAGVTNLLTGFAGGLIGFQDLSYTVLNHRVGAQNRIAGLISGAICLVALLVGLTLIAFIPKAMLGGILLFMGLEFWDEWLVAARKKLEPLDYGLVLLMVVVIALSDFLVGVGLGLVLTVIKFLVNYSRTNIFQHILSGSEVASKVIRTAHHQRELTRMGKRILILELRGFIFFGTANKVMEQVHNQEQSAGEPGLRYLILDFRRVTGLDSSAVFGFTKLKYLADSREMTLIFTNIAEKIRQQMSRNGLVIGDDIQVFEDLDHGLEWCEDQLLETHQITTRLALANIRSQLAQLGFAKENTDKLRPYLEAVTRTKGEYLLRQDEPSPDLYFIEVGNVTVYLELPGDKQVRVQAHNMGTFVGELGFYMGAPRTASVVADTNVIAYRLTQKAIEEMKVKDPELAIAFHELMLHVIAERLADANRELMALNR